MDALLLALLLTLALDQGAGTQRVAARFGTRFSGSEDAPTPIVAGLALMTAFNALIAAALGGLVASFLAPDARLLFLALALLMGGLGLLMTACRPAPAEKEAPITGLRTLFHFALRRAGENAAFATTGVAAFTSAPVLTATGAMLGGWAALILPLSLGVRPLRHWAMRTAQIGLGLIILCAGIACTASALHLF